MEKRIKIENRVIGEGEKCFIIGEIGSNHNLDKGVVRGLIDMAKDAGLDAVKFQIYDAEEAFSKNVTTADVGLEGMYGKGPWWKIVRDRILMPREWFGEMFEYARKKGIIPFCTIHRIEDAGFLLDLGSSIFKIASIDCNHLPFIKEIAKFNRPLLLSTGMAHVEEIDQTMKAIHQAGNNEVIVLHCVSCYPPRPEIVNLNNITMLKNRYDCPVGFSDHAQDNTFAVASVALGSCVIEKHLTLDRKMEGPDHAFALEPQDMKGLVESVRSLEKALGEQKRILSKDELAARDMIRRSIVAKKDIKKGSSITMESVKFSRPGIGISPNLFEEVKHKKAKRDISAETLISWEMIG